MLIQQPMLHLQQFTVSIRINSATSWGTLPLSMQHQTTTPLFGGPSPWNETGVVAWISVDDRVRGGSSQSHLETQTSATGEQAARFWGVLDTKTLGGAGFASVTTQYVTSDTSFDLSSYDGILLNVTRSDDKRYTFNLKDEVPDRRDDGRMKSGISWEYDFYGNSPAGSSTPATQVGYEQGASEDPVLVYIPWGNFTATYRGREVEHPEPLKTNHIRRFSIMTRSFFDKQDGDFEIVFNSISAYLGQHGDVAGSA